MIRESNLLSSRYEDPILVILFSRKLKGRSDIACAHIFSFTYLIIKLKFLNYPIIARPISPISHFTWLEIPHSCIRSRNSL